MQQRRQAKQLWCMHLRGGQAPRALLQGGQLSERAASSWAWQQPTCLYALYRSATRSSEMPGKCSPNWARSIGRSAYFTVRWKASCSARRRRPCRRASRSLMLDSTVHVCLYYASKTAAGLVSSEAAEAAGSCGSLEEQSVRALTL